MHIRVVDCLDHPALDAAAAKAIGWIEYELDGLKFWSSPAQIPGGREATGYLVELPTHPDLGFVLPSHLLIYGGEGVWRPSVDIRAAWKLWQRIEGLNWVDFYDHLRDLCTHHCDGRSIAPVERNYEGISEYDVIASINPLAITRAFLLARGIEHIET